MTNKQFNEAKHPRDTGGQIIYDIHCPYCVMGEHTEVKIITNLI